MNICQETYGLLIKSVEGLEKYSELVTLSLEDGRRIRFYHEQDCCESVLLEDFEGEETDLVGGRLFCIEEVSDADGPPPEHPDSFTWTFYKIVTSKGYVWLRWLGESNGYYSEEITVSID